MNAITDDLGQIVPAVGMPGSIARARAQWPALIALINAQHQDTHGGGSDLAIEAIRAAGIRDANQTSAILAASRYGKRGDTTAALTIRLAPLYRDWSPEWSA